MMKWPFQKSSDPRALRALRALAVLLTYPRPELLAALEEIRTVLLSSGLFKAAERQSLGALLDELSLSGLMALEARYVELFDQGRARSLHLFEHIYGDSRERGAALVSLGERYQAAGLTLAPGEMPDFLPVLLEFLSCRSQQEAYETLNRCAQVLRSVGEALLRSDSAYSAVFDALLSFCGQPPLERKTDAAPVEMPLDQAWAEAPAFAEPREPGGETPAAVIRFEQRSRMR